MYYKQLCLNKGMLCLNTLNFITYIIYGSKEIGQYVAKTDTAVLTCIVLDVSPECLIALTF